MTKLARQKAILEIVQQGPVASQEHLQRGLHKRGCRVGQATLSRDIHDLNLVKTADGYARMQAGSAPDPALPPVSRLVRRVVQDRTPGPYRLGTQDSGGKARPV